MSQITGNHDNDSDLAEVRRMNVRHSTTRPVVGASPKLHYKSADRPPSLHRLPEGKDRRVEGGLRTKGIHEHQSSNPVITVITVVFNGASTIEDTIKSVMSQTYDNVEYIIIDGGSDDGTLEIIQKYESVISYWVSERDNGIYDAMNKGISLATGEYLGMLNSDDYFAMPNVLQDIAEAFNAHNADCVFSCLNIVDRNNSCRVLRCYRVANLHPRFFRIGIMPPHPTLYCKKSVYEKVGYYRTDYRAASDFEIMIRMFATEKISWHFLDEVTINMRAGGVSNSGVGGQIQQNFEIVRACKENGFYTNIFLVALKLPFKLFQHVAAKMMRS